MTHRDFYVGLFEAHRDAESLLGRLIRKSIEVQERLATDGNVPVYDSALCDDATPRTREPSARRSR